MPPQLSWATCKPCLYEHEHSGLPDLGAVGTDSRASSWAAAQPHSPHHGLSCPARLVWSPGMVSGHCSGGRGQAPPRRCPRSSACPPRGPLPTRTDLMAIWRLTSLPLTRLVLVSATSGRKPPWARSGQVRPLQPGDPQYTQSLASQVSLALDLAGTPLFPLLAWPQRLPGDRMGDQ